MSASVFRLALNTGAAEPSGSAAMLTSGVISPRVIPTFMFSTHLLFPNGLEFGHFLNAITEVFRGNHELLGVPLAKSAPSEDALEEFGWLECAIREFCLAFDTLSDMTSSENMFATM